MKKTAKQTAADVVFEQHRIIVRAIQILQDQLDNMTCPDESTTWGDVTDHSFATDVARSVIGSFED